MKCCFGAKNATVSSRNVVIDEGAEQKVVRAEQDVAKTDASVKESALAAQIRADMYETAAFEGPWGMREPTYVDFAASGRMLKSLDAILESQVYPWYANTHTETAEFGRRMHVMMEESRDHVARAVGADRKEYAVIFTGAGSTQAIAKMATLVSRPRPYIDDKPSVKQPLRAASSRLSRVRTTTPWKLGKSNSFFDKVSMRAAGLPLAMLFRGKDTWQIGAMSNQQIKRRPAVLFVGPFEHHSNELAWREAGLDVVVIGEDSEGRVNLDELADWLKKCMDEDPTRLLVGSFSAGSNVTGITAQVDDIAELMHKYRGLAFFDYAGDGSYIPIEMEPKDRPNAYKDAVFASPHKFIGGPGSAGILIAKRELFDPFDAPSVPGGGTVQIVTREGHVYHEDPEAREEAGTPNVIANIRTGLAFDLLHRTFMDKELKSYEHAMVKQLVEGLMAIDNVIVVGADRPAFFDYAQRCSIVPFLIKAPTEAGPKPLLLHQNFVAAVLNDLYGIQSRGGCSCAGPYGTDLLRQLLGDVIQFKGDLKNLEPALLKPVVEENEVCNKVGWCRVSIKYVLRPSDIDYMLDAVRQIAQHGWKISPQYKVGRTSGEWTHRFSPKRVQIYQRDAVPEPMLPTWGNPIKSTVSAVPKGVKTGQAARKEYLKEAAMVYASAPGWCKEHWEQDPSDFEDDDVLSKASERMRWWLMPHEAVARMEETA